MRHDRRAGPARSRPAIASTMSRCAQATGGVVVRVRATTTLTAPTTASLSMRRCREGCHCLARVDPNRAADAESEVSRAVTELGCVGVYLDPDEDVFGAQLAAPVVREAQRLGGPVVISAGIPRRSEPLQVLDLVRQVPDATIIIGRADQHLRTQHDRCLVRAYGARALDRDVERRATPRERAHVP